MTAAAGAGVRRGLQCSSVGINDEIQLACIDCIELRHALLYLSDPKEKSVLLVCPLAACWNVRWRFLGMSVWGSAGPLCLTATGWTSLQKSIRAIESSHDVLCFYLVYSARLVFCTMAILSPSSAWPGN